MIIASGTGSKDTQPDPEQDRQGNPMPAWIQEILMIVQVLTTYGHHLASFLDNHATWRGFSTIARFFGTVAVPEIAARIQRGLMRAAALEALLRQRAQHGRDPVIAVPNTRIARTNPPAPAPYEAPERNSRRAWQPPLTLETLPSKEKIEAEVRRRPIGSTVAAICLDLGISPSLCAGPFWNRLFETIQDYRGNLIAVVSELHRRVERFENEDWKRGHLPWPERTREGIRKVLGSFIGEDPFQPAPAATAGPS